MSHPALDLSDPRLAARLQGRDLAIAASAGSGKTFTLVALVLGFLGRGGHRAHEVLATTFSREAAADLKARLLAPLDELAALGDGDWAPLLRALHAGWPDWDAAARALRGETRLAARQWPGATEGAGEEWPAWTLAPAKARHHWLRARREAEHLRTETVHGLALGVLQNRSRSAEDATRELLDAEDPRLLALLRRAGRRVLILPAADPDHLLARRLLAWLEVREGQVERWARVAAALDAHTDASGGWRDASALEDARETFWAQAREGLEAYRAFADNPDLAGKVKKGGGLHANFETYGRRKFGPLPRPDATPAALLRFWQQWFEAFPKEGGGLPNYYSEAYGAAMGEIQAALPELLEFWLGLLMERVLQAFEAEKQARGWRSYGDLVRDALRALRAGPPDPAPQLLLVDEYQDINPAQEAFLQALGAAAAVRVGDRKQAIYGFRGGVADLLDARLAAAAPRGDAYRLPVNHRSTAPVVAVANTFVADLMPALDPGAFDPDGLQTDLGRGAGAPMVALARVDSERPLSADLPAAAPWIAAFATEAGWVGLGAAGEAGGPRRRALLLPRRTGLPALRRLLQAQGVEPLVVSQDGFWDSPGVRTLMNLLECLARPERPGPLLALLRGPWFGCADSWLLAAAPALSKGWLASEADVLRSPWAEAQAWLRDLATRTTQEVLGRALARPGLLEALEALAVHGRLEPERARRNLDRFLGLAMELPAHPGLAWMELSRRRQKAEGDAPPSEAGGASALLIQTIHGAKGLEYDDVILPMLNYGPKGIRKGELGRLEGGRHLVLGWKLGRVPGPGYRGLQAEDARRVKREELNLLYVGLTRARERMALLQQWRLNDGAAEAPPAASERLAQDKGVRWPHVAEELARRVPDILRLEKAPQPAAPGVLEAPLPSLAPPAPGAATPPSPAEAIPPEREARRREGSATHTLLRECLVRDAAAPAAVEAHLARSPLAAAWPAAAGRVRAFLAALEAAGWRELPRRTEFPLPGGGAEGGMGYADLVVWEPERRAPRRIHLVDFKLAAAPDAARLEAYGEQLKGYAAALRRLHPGVGVEAHLWSLERGEWLAAPAG